MGNKTLRGCDCNLAKAGRNYEPADKIKISQINWTSVI